MSGAGIAAASAGAAVSGGIGAASGGKGGKKQKKSDWEKLAENPLFQRNMAREEGDYNRAKDRINVTDATGGQVNWDNKNNRVVSTMSPGQWKLYQGQLGIK